MERYIPSTTALKPHQTTQQPLTSLSHATHLAERACEFHGGGAGGEQGWEVASEGCDECTQVVPQCCRWHHGRGGGKRPHRLKQRGPFLGGLWGGETGAVGARAVRVLKLQVDKLWEVAS